MGRFKAGFHRYLYAVRPGYVHSADGDRHFITAVKLVELYGVSANVCLFVEPRNHYSSLEYSSLLRITEKLIQLRPDPTGKYVIPS